jgi:hydroxyacid-oxoacid transhydrogenase
MSVVLNAPAVFRFTGQADPERHLEAARLMGMDVSKAKKKDAGEILANAFINLMKKTGMPNGLSAVGYTSKDVDKMVEGTLPQRRVLNISPRPVTADDLKALFLESLTCW